MAARKIRVRERLEALPGAPLGAPFGSGAARGAADAVWLIDSGGGAQREALPRAASSAATAHTALSSVLSRVFLPEGYPASVRPEYLVYQAWDTLQVRGSSTHF
jgi:hypothetical protein